MIGKIVSDRYEIKKYLGGGMSSVYLAADIILNRDVVVKMIKADPLDKEKSVRRFQREVESTIQLSHPNIVSVMDVDDTEEYHILVTEVVDGVNLKEHILRQSPLDIDEIISIAMMTLRGIEHAHERGIIHRDIKPQNILIDASGRVKITDFGIAKALSETRMTETNHVIGSVQYISPEQAKGQTTDERTDIYSFGIVLFELVTGRLPYDAETAVSIALKHISEPFPDVLQYRDIPVGLKNIIMKCTEKNPLDRYRHASDVLSALVHYEDETTPYLINNAGSHDKTTVSPVAPAGQASESQGAVAPGGNIPAEPAKKKRRKWPWVLFILLFLLAAAAIITYLMWPRQAPTVDLQNLQNMTVAEAEEYLASEELLLGEVSEEYNDNFEEGFIIETTPVSGVTIERGQPVDILVSLGEEPYKMKDYVGDDHTEVTSELEALGFNIEIQGEYSEEPVDSILEQSLEVGEEVYPENENLTFIVSQGLEPIPITNYAGTQLETARAELESNGFIVEVTMEMYSDDVPEGAVVSQSPNYGDFLPGSFIEIIVSLGPEPPDETTYRVSLDIPYPEAASSSEDKKEDKDPKPLEAVIYIDDKDNEFSEEAETLEITEDTNHSIQLILLDGEPGRYRVEVDGKEVISETIENE